MTPVSVAVSRAGQSEQNKVPAAICFAFTPVKFLAGKVDVKRDFDPATSAARKHSATEWLDTTLCGSVGIGSRGGELKLTGSHALRANFTKGLDEAGNMDVILGSAANLQDEVKLRAEYNSPAISDRKIRFNVAAEGTATFQPKTDQEPVFVGAVTAGGAF